MLESSAIKYLNDFIALAHAGNYTKACDQLYLSKTTLTKHIKDLEASVEHKLFAVSGHKLVLTEFGKLFLDYAERFAALDMEYEQARSSFDEDASSEVRVAVSVHMNCDHMMNMLWDHFVPSHPQYHLSTMEYQAAALSREDLFAMGYELVFGLSRTPTDSSYGCFTWAESTLNAILPPSHPLAAKSSLHLTELAAESFVLPPRDTSLYRLVVEVCQEAGFDPHINFTIQGSANLAELVSGNVGVSISTANDIPACIYAVADIPAGDTPAADRDGSSAGSAHSPGSSGSSAHSDDSSAGAAHSTGSSGSAVHSVGAQVSIVPLDPPIPVYLNLYYRKDRALSRPARCFFDYAKLIHRDHQMDIPYYGPEAGVENPFFK